MKLKSLENIYDEFTRTEKREEVHEKYEEPAITIIFIP